MRRPSCSISLAPMCWVMPPRSPAATSVVRMASSRLVLPWSTWPITVTIGARGWRARRRPPRRGPPWWPRRGGPSASPRSGAVRRRGAARRPRSPSSLVTRVAVSRSISWLMLAKMPLLISSRMMSAALTPSSSASSLTVIGAGISTAPRSVGSIVWTCDASLARSRRGGLRGPRMLRVPLRLRPWAPPCGCSMQGPLTSRSDSSEVAGDPAIRMSARRPRRSAWQRPHPVPLQVRLSSLAGA